MESTLRNISSNLKMWKRNQSVSLEKKSDNHGELEAGKCFHVFRMCVKSNAKRSHFLASIEFAGCSKKNISVMFLQYSRQHKSWERDEEEQWHTHNHSMRRGSARAPHAGSLGIDGRRTPALLVPHRLPQTQRLRAGRSLFRGFERF